VHASSAATRPELVNEADVHASELELGCLELRERACGACRIAGHTIDFHGHPGGHRIIDNRPHRALRAIELG